MKLLSFRACLAAPLLSAVVAFPQSASPSASEADARALEIGRAYMRFQEQLRTIGSTPDPTPWWRTPLGAYTFLGTREKIAQANREFYDAIRRPLGAEPVPATGRDMRYSFLPEAKQLLVAQIDQSYNDKLAELRRDSPSVRLPADTEKAKQLAATRERDLMAILTKEEFEMLDMRTSPSSMTIRQRFGEAIESEDEFRRLFVLQKTFDEKFPIEDAYYSSRQQELMRQRSEAERKLMDDIHAAVGDEHYVRLRRAMDQDFQVVRAIVRRLNLPETAIEETVRIRENYATQSMTVNAETSLNSMDRRALVQDLAKEARKELTTVLTPPGLEMYSGRSQWLRYLEQGTAFSTNPKDSPSGFGSLSQSIFPVFSGTVITSSSSSTVTPASSTSGSMTLRRARPANGAAATPTPGTMETKTTPERPSADAPAPAPKP